MTKKNAEDVRDELSVDREIHTLLTLARKQKEYHLVVEKNKLYQQVEAIVRGGKIKDPNKLVGQLWHEAMKYTLEEEHQGAQKWIDLAVEVVEKCGRLMLSLQAWHESTNHRIKTLDISKWNALARSEWLLDSTFIEHACVMGRRDLIEAATACGYNLNQEKSGVFCDHTNKTLMECLIANGWDPMRENHVGVSEMEYAFRHGAFGQVMSKAFLKMHPEKEREVRDEWIKAQIKTTKSQKELNALWVAVRDELNTNTRRCFFSKQQQHFPIGLAEEMRAQPIDRDVPYLIKKLLDNKVDSIQLCTVLNRKGGLTEREFVLSMMCYIKESTFNEAKENTMRLIENASEKGVKMLYGFWSKKEVELRQKMIHWTDDEIASLKSVMEKTVLSEGRVYAKNKKRVAL